jgi:hypothetical protein
MGRAGLAAVEAQKGATRLTLEALAQLIQDEVDPLRLAPGARAGTLR